MIVERYKKLFKNDDVFQEASKETSLKKGDIARSNQILKSFIIDKFIPTMRKNDEYFDEMFREVKYVGSYYKNLKVSKPNEFDMNLVIKLPIDYDNIEVNSSMNEYGFVTLRVNKKLLNIGDVAKETRFWSMLLNENGFMDQNEFRSWIQGVFDKAMNELNYKFKSKRKTYKISLRQHSPAFTLHIEEKNAAHRDPIDFDLVPVLEFEEKKLNGFKLRNPDEFTTVARPLFIERLLIRNLLWRVSFYNEEKKLLKGHILPMIRIVKKFRDKEMPWLNSHIIEAFFLHELESKKFKQEFKKVSRTCILMSTLRELQKKLEAKTIFSYWHPKDNLLARKNRQQIEVAADRLKNIIEEIEMDPKNLRRYLV